MDSGLPAGATYNLLQCTATGDQSVKRLDHWVWDQCKSEAINRFSLKMVKVGSILKSIENGKSTVKSILNGKVQNPRRRWGGQSL